MDPQQTSSLNRGVGYTDKVGRIESFFEKAGRDVRGGFFAEIGRWLARLVFLAIGAIVLYLGGITLDIFGMVPSWAGTGAFLVIVATLCFVLMRLVKIYAKGKEDNRASKIEDRAIEKQKIDLMQRDRDEKDAQDAAQQALAESIWELKPRVMELQQRYSVMEEDEFKKHLSNLYARLCGIAFRFSYFSLSSDYEAQRQFFGVVMELMTREQPSYEGVKVMLQKAQDLETGRFRGLD